MNQATNAQIPTTNLKYIANQTYDPKRLKTSPITPKRAKIGVPLVMQIYRSSNPVFRSKSLFLV